MRACETVTYIFFSLCFIYDQRVYTYANYIACERDVFELLCHAA